VRSAGILNQSAHPLEVAVRRCLVAGLANAVVAVRKTFIATLGLCRQDLLDDANALGDHERIPPLRMARARAAHLWNGRAGSGSAVRLSVWGLGAQRNATTTSVGLPGLVAAPDRPLGVRGNLAHLESSERCRRAQAPLECARQGCPAARAVFEPASGPAPRCHPGPRPSDEGASGETASGTATSPG